MEKVTLPCDVAEALEILTQKYGELAVYDLAQIHSLASGMEFCAVIDVYARNHPKEYFSAVINGYTIEQTPEEKVREYYDELYAEVNNGSFSPVREKAAELCGLERTLDLLGIKIEGVNA